MNATLNNRKLAIVLSTAERFVGGYIYGGTTFGLKVDGEARIPRFDQLVHSTKEHDTRPIQGLAAHNKRLLTALPIGSEVILDSRLCGYVGRVSYQKVGPCLWEEIEAWDEVVE